MADRYFLWDAHEMHTFFKKKILNFFAFKSQKWENVNEFYLKIYPILTLQIINLRIDGNG